MVGCGKNGWLVIQMSRDTKTDECGLKGWHFLCFREIVSVACWIFLICIKLCISTHLDPSLCLCISLKMPRTSLCCIGPCETILLLWLQIVIHLQELNRRQSNLVLRKAENCASEIMTVEMNNLRDHKQCPLLLKLSSTFQYHQ